MTTEASIKAMALVDGQLDPVELPDLVHELARDPRLLAQAQTFLALSRARVSEPYKDCACEPVPAWLADTVMHADVPTAFGQPAKPLAYVRELLGRIGETYRAPRWSLAAGPALAAAVVALAAWLLLPTSSQSETMVTAQLQNALEKAPGGQDMQMIAFRPTLTFWSKDQTWCRQFEVRYSRTGQAVAGVACRNNTGGWDVLKAAPPTPMGSPVPAGSAREEVDRFVTETMVGAPLERAQVNAKIGQGWPPLE